jgi:hypothetical protein
LDGNEDLEPTDMDDDDGDGGGIDDELEDGDDFYSSKVAGKSKEKKAVKKSLYQVAPKYPRPYRHGSGERTSHFPDDSQVLKNRGLVSHKAKINRNPRVKKREQYRKVQDWKKQRVLCEKSVPSKDKNTPKNKPVSRRVVVAVLNLYPNLDMLNFAAEYNIFLFELPRSWRHGRLAHSAQ